jgi:hypothetical protein
MTKTMGSDLKEFATLKIGIVFLQRDSLTRFCYTFLFDWKDMKFVIFSYLNFKKLALAFIEMGIADPGIVTV